MKTILVIDDEQDLRYITAEIIRARGYTVIEAGNGIEALDIVHRITPDLIICDLMMPEMDGEQFIGALKNTRDLALIPIVLMSGECQLERIATRLQVASFLDKVLDGNKLLCTIASILNGKQV